MINRVDLNPQTVQNYSYSNSGNRVEQKSSTEESGQVDRVAQLKSQIESGEYRLDMVATAQKFLQETIF
jgi:anti-sigma28 factor (negative regulator of flagellin synthesis)